MRIIFVVFFCFALVAFSIGWYFNHSSTPNIAKKSKKPNAEAVKNIKKRTVHAIQDIKAGDEILIDYNYLDEPEHLKEDYYKQ